MEAIDCIKTRRSIRKFLDKPVPFSDIANILDCGRIAPSAGNLQNWKFIIIKEQGSKEQIAKACVDQMWISTASYLIVIVSETEKMKRYYDIRGERLYTIQSCAAAAQNMLLAAHDVGLGACWIGAFDEEKIRSIIECPVDTRIQVVIPIGYPAENPEKPNKFPLEIVCYLETWRRKISDVEKIGLGIYSPKVERTVKRGVDLIRNAPKNVKKHGKKVVEHIKKKVKDMKKSKRR